LGNGEDGDEEETIINRQILQKIHQDGDDVIIRRKVGPTLPLVEDETAKNLIVIPLNHLVHKKAAAKNQILPDHHLQKITVLKGLHELLGGKDLNQNLHRNN
jgi:hypothetical protein